MGHWTRSIFERLALCFPFHDNSQLNGEQQKIFFNHGSSRYRLRPLVKWALALSWLCQAISVGLEDI